jgi:hypothetical protein
MEQIPFRLEPVPEKTVATLIDPKAPRGRVAIGDWGADMLPQLPLLKVSVRMRLRILAVEELKIDGAATWPRIMNAARRRTLLPLPAEYVLALRFAYVDQPEQQFLRLAHSDIIAAPGRSCRFALYRSGDTLLLLGRESGGGEAVWPKDCLFGFLAHQ